jgi:hypothetical protein
MKQPQTRSSRFFIIKRCPGKSTTAGVGIPSLSDTWEWHDNIGKCPNYNEAESFTI